MSVIKANVNISKQIECMYKLVLFKNPEVNQLTLLRFYYLQLQV